MVPYKTCDNKISLSLTTEGKLCILWLSKDIDPHPHINLFRFMEYFITAESWYDGHSATY